MQSTHLACPHCGSTLNFGVDIAAGTPLECMICMQTFVAEQPISVGSATLCADVTSTMSDAAAAPEPTAVAEKSEPILTAKLETLVSTAANLSIDAVDLPTMSEPATAEIPKAVPKPASSVKRAPKGDILVSKPFNPPAASAVTEKSQPMPVPAPAKHDLATASMAAPSIRKEDESAMGKTVLLAAVTVGLLLFLTGGVAFAIWKITTPPRSAAPVEEKLVVGEKPKDPIPKAEDPEGEKKQVLEPPLPPLSAEEQANHRAKVLEDVKQTLKRKIPLKPGDIVPDPEPEPIAVIGFTKKPIVGLDQEKINAAIDKGVAYLKRTQNADGTWHRGNGVGHAAIGGLTLLECDVPKKDLTVQKAAAYVRANSANLNATYELSLAILFLDRLGYERDRPLIQGMALKLLAGQNDHGGWTYQCKQLNPKEMYQLYTFLQSHKQPNLLNPIGGDPKTQAGIVVNPKRDPVKLDDPFQQLNDLILTQGIADAKSDPKADPKKDKVIVPIEVDPKKTTEVKKPPIKPIRPETLLPSLQTLPIVQNQEIKKEIAMPNPKGKAKGKGKFKGGVNDDNSNTQFAMLALWAARRHNVPTDSALIAAYQRFQVSQQGDGTWGYHFNTGHNPSTMTNVGLLGMAMGHGAAPEIIGFDPKNPKEFTVKPALKDEAVVRGLAALSRFIGQPVVDPKNANFPMQNLYFLWSIERVAMLYDLKTIGGKDWYGWGAQILVHNQAAGGEWPTSSYHGQNPPLNTCFALLFLRRSNLVQDLTNNLRLSTGIADPEK